MGEADTQADEIARVLAPKDRQPRDITGCVIKPGDYVLVPKGTEVWTFFARPWIYRASRKIRVIDAYPAFASGVARISWKGRTGCWSKCNAQDVRLIPP